MKTASLFLKKKLDKNIKCFCVGNATEKKARSIGFQNTIAAEGNVTNLKELIIQSYESKNKIWKSRQYSRF